MPCVWLIHYLDDSLNLLSPPADGSKGLFFLSRKSVSQRTIQLRPQKQSLHIFLPSNKCEKMRANSDSYFVFEYSKVVLLGGSTSRLATNRQSLEDATAGEDLRQWTWRKQSTWHLHNSTLSAAFNLLFSAPWAASFAVPLPCSALYTLLCAATMTQQKHSSVHWAARSLDIAIWASFVYGYLQIVPRTAGPSKQRANETTADRHALTCLYYPETRCAVYGTSGGNMRKHKLPAT